jgi:hypothetical protein
LARRVLADMVRQTWRVEVWTVEAH